MQRKLYSYDNFDLTSINGASFLFLVGALYAGILLGDHANSVIFDNSKIKRFVPGFKCEIPFAVGAKRIADWYQAHTEAKIGDPEWEKEMDAICKL